MGQNWSFVGSSAVFEQLQKSLRWSRIPIHLLHVPPSLLKDASPSQIVFDEVSAQDSLAVGDLLRLQQMVQLSSVGSIGATFLQDFLDLLVEADLLRGRFAMPFGTFQMRLKRVADVLVSAMLLILLVL